MLNLLLFEYQEFLHQPPSMTQFETAKVDEGPDEKVSKYAHVFNQVCELISLEVDEFNNKTAEIYRQVQEVRANQDIIQSQTVNIEA